MTVDPDEEGESEEEVGAVEREGVVTDEVSSADTLLEREGMLSLELEGGEDSSTPETGKRAVKEKQMANRRESSLWIRGIKTSFISIY